MEKDPMIPNYFAINEQTVRLIDASVLLRALSHVREGLNVLGALKPASSDVLQKQYTALRDLYEAEAKRRGLRV